MKLNILEKFTSLCSSITNNQGIATFTYSVNTKGLTNFSVDNTLQQILCKGDTILLEAPLTSAIPEITFSNLNQAYYNDNGLRLKSTSWGDAIILIGLNGNWSVKWTITYFGSSYDLYFNVKQNTTNKFNGRINSSRTVIDTDNAKNYNVGGLGTYEIKYIDGIFSISKDGTPYASQAVNAGNGCTFSWGIGPYDAAQIKDLTIKKL